MSVRDPCWWHINRVPINVIKMWLMQTRWVFLISCKGLWHPIPVTWSGVSVHSHYNHVNGHQIQWLRRQNVSSQPPDGGPCGCAIQIRKGPEEMGALGSSPSLSPSWPLARRPPPSHPNTRPRNTCDINWRDRCSTSNIPCLDSAFSGGYATLCQNRSHCSHGNGPR